MMAAALCSPAAWANTTVWAPEVPGGYPFATKVNPANGSAGYDGNMCWAAATSDLVEYWQRRYAQQTGSSCPEGIPSGSDNSQRYSAVFDLFHEAWDNRAYNVESGLYWYFSGYSHPYNTYLHEGYEGGYWKEYCSQLGYGDTYDSLSKNSYHRGIFAGVPSMEDQDGWADFVYGGLGDFIRTSLEGGSLVALSLTSTSGVSGHYVTLYGAEYDDQDNLVALFIHDNNTKNSQETTRVEVTTTKMFEYVDQKDENGVETKLELEYEVLTYGSWYIKAADSLALPIVVPEPATATLSLLALAGLAARRRRS